MAGGVRHWQRDSGVGAQAAFGQTTVVASGVAAAAPNSGGCGTGALTAAVVAAVSQYSSTDDDVAAEVTQATQVAEADDEDGDYDDHLTAETQMVVPTFSCGPYSRMLAAARVIVAKSAAAPKKPDVAPAASSAPPGLARKRGRYNPESNVGESVTGSPASRLRFEEPSASNEGEHLEDAQAPLSLSDLLDLDL